MDAKITGSTWEFKLSDPSNADQYDESVAQTLQQVFFLDCLCRTEGYYEVRTHEYEVFNKRHELDWKALYDSPIDERVGRYLDVPYNVIADLVPEWRLTADMQPGSEYVEALPYLASDLAAIRCPDIDTTVETPEAPDEITDFLRDAESSSSTDKTFVDIPEASSVEHTWVGDADPFKIGKTTIDSFERKLSSELQRDGDLEVAVVINDLEMIGEKDRLESHFEELSYSNLSVDVTEAQTTDELHELLQRNIDFVHYIGHVSEDGISCVDGFYDARTHQEYGPDAFMLNGCSSYVQGSALTNGGCVGGIVTTSEVLNAPAMDIGVDFVRLIIDGFSLRSAIDIARDQRLIGNQYLVIGEGDFRLGEQAHVIPFICDAERINKDHFELSIETYPTSTVGIGSVFTPHIPGIDKKYLTSGQIDTLSVTYDQFMTFLEMTTSPIIYKDELMWPPELIERM